MRILNWLKNKYPNVFEFAKFLISGAVATLVDMFIMGIILYFVDPKCYDYRLLNAFISSANPSTLLVVLASAGGFLVGLVFNYLLSTFFVYTGGNPFSKTKIGILLFALLSIIGLGLQSLGILLLYGVLAINEWISKIVMVIIVIIYNYITRKLFIYKTSFIKKEKN